MIVTEGNPYSMLVILSLNRTIPVRLQLTYAWVYTFEDSRSFALVSESLMRELVSMLVLTSGDLSINHTIDAHAIML